MANNLISTFNKYNLTPEELVVARTFHHLQQEELHNLRTAYAEDKLRLLADDPSEDVKFFRRIAYLDGCMAVLSYLIDLNPEVEVTTEA